jgi:hypothetical protein
MSYDMHMFRAVVIGVNHYSQAPNLRTVGIKVIVALT